MMSTPLKYLHGIALRAAQAYEDAGNADRKARQELAKLAPVQPGGIIEFERAPGYARAGKRRIQVTEVYVQWDYKGRDLMWRYVGNVLRADNSMGKVRDCCDKPILL